MTSAHALPSRDLRIGVDVGGTKIEAIVLDRAGKYLGSAACRYTARRLRGDCSGDRRPGSQRRIAKWRHRDGRPGHTRRDFTPYGGGEERQFRLAQRPSLWPRSRTITGKAGAAGERCELPCRFRSGRWRRRRCRRGVRRHSRNGRRGRNRRAGQGPDRRQCDRR